MTEVAEINADIGDDWFEIIEGVKIMAPSAGGSHNFAAGRLFSALDRYIDDNELNAVAILDVDVYLPDGNIFRPDLCVITDPKLIGKDDKVHGAPALCIEVLSRSTANRDLGIKMQLYAKNGVREYWIVNRPSKAILVYKLNGDRYELDGVYQSPSETELAEMTDEERAEIKTEMQVGIFPELLIDVKRIFKWLFD